MDPKRPEPATRADAQSSLALVRRLARDNLWPQRGRVALAIAMMAIVAASTAANAWLMQPALDKIYVARDQTWLFVVPLALIAVAIAKGVAAYVENVTMSHIGERIVAETQMRVFTHLTGADLAWLHRIHSGRLVSTFLYDATLLRDAVAKALTGMVKDALSLAFLVAVMFYQYWQLSLIVCFVFPLVGVGARHVGRRTRKGSRRTQEETGRLATIVQESFNGARLVKAYGLEEREIARARRSLDARFHQIMKVVRAGALVSPTTEALGAIAIAVAILFSGLVMAEGTVTLGGFASFITAMLLAYRPLKSLANLHTTLQAGLAAAERLFALLDTRATVADRPDAAPLPEGPGELRFEAVSFTYADNGPPALYGLTFTVPAGAKIALVGPSGAGKSTVLNLIPRLYEPTAGRVLVDGADIAHATLASLRARIALVSQDTVLFDDTVLANIALGRPGAERAAIEAAARAAAAHEFIEALPEGYDTMIGENGVKLSGGQRQRLAIARAMLRDAPILLLDEATSALDNESERRIQEALLRLMAGRTTIVVAHRLSTVIDADEILVLDRGRLVDRGRHADLLARGGLYAELYRREGGDTAAA